MTEVKYIQKECERKEIHQTLDLRNAVFPYFTDKIVLSRKDGKQFVLDHRDFELIYEMKENGTL